MPGSLPTRALPERPNLDQLKRQAKELLDAFRAADQAAVAEVGAYFHGTGAGAFALHDAQLVLARAYGFESWPKLKAWVDGARVRRLVEAVRAGRIAEVRELLRMRPELARMSADNCTALHFAVLADAPELVRLLMQHGADAHAGIYPHRDATTPVTIATERGYADIVEIIRGEEGRRRAQHTGDEWPPLHQAAWTLNEGEIRALLERGANPNEPARLGLTPLDMAASAVARSTAGFREHFTRIANLLQRRGAAMTDRAAVALGEADWIRARHAERGLATAVSNGAAGLLRIAVTHDRSDMLALLLDLGVDPDERVRVGGIDEIQYSWGFPLWECAATGKHEMAEILLSRGADPNASVEASGSPIHQAYGQRDRQMIELLERYGARIDAPTAAVYRQTALAKRLFDEVGDQPDVQERVLWSAACGGDTEIVRLALARIDWARTDPRWFNILEQPLRIWNHGSGHWTDETLDRSTYVECFRLVLARADPNIRGRVQDSGTFGLTILHSVAGSRGHVTAAERVAFATLLLDAGARPDIRDHILASTPLGWACRWGRAELVALLLDRGADPIETEAQPWASPRAWAERMGHANVLALLDGRG
jgi:ankyrin repeat protein